MDLEKEYLSNPYNDKDYLQSLIASGINVNETDVNGQALLHKTQNPECIKMLVAANANVNIKDDFGDTPLHLLARYPNKRKGAALSEDIYFDIPKLKEFFMLWKTGAEILVAAGADVNCKNKKYEFPLFGCFNSLMVDFLLSKGANPLSRVSREEIFGPASARDFIEYRCWQEREKVFDDAIVRQNVDRVSAIEKSLKKAEKEWHIGNTLDKAEKEENASPKVITGQKVKNVGSFEKIKE